MRFLNFLLFSALVALAVVIYEVKYETGRLERGLSELRLKVKVERDAIAVLRAEWSHLNRPERIERLARKHLGLRPLGARQMLTLDQLRAHKAKRASDLDSAPRGPADSEARRQPVSVIR